MIKIPLLKDHHNHFFTYSALNKAIDLFTINSKDKALQIIGEHQHSNITIVKGWFDAYYKFSDADINRFPPLIIINNSLHKYLFNEAAAEIIKTDFPDWIENNNNQNWVEKNLMQILAYISTLNKFNKNSYKTDLNLFLSKGVYFASDMFVTDIAIIDFLSNNNKNERTEIWTSPDLFPELNNKQKSVCKGVKMFTDGALGANTAAIKNYKFNSNPILTYTNQELFQKIEQFLEFNTGIAIHCIGDIAIEQTITCLEENKNQIGKYPIRLEHAQFITKKQAFRAKDLDLILSMQPNFNMDSIIYSDRLDKEYCKANNPFRMLIDKADFIPGKDLILGSDGMPTGIEGCIQQSIFPPISEQKLSLDEFVAAYCIDNTNHGHIEIEIDQLKKKVISRIICKNNL
ncbi:MAG: amidohydrolase family protein [Bacteroidales bacterium]|nr:amidohydrolase family protein [Bacteroidales bacterium]MDD4217582.1 amidohydrolase family protein [Bacteroidales bacterium]MDY0142363.1 amidohydrolase family protein [Bacteroidales bacterium]